MFNPNVFRTFAGTVLYKLNLLDGIKEHTFLYYQQVLEKTVLLKR